MRTLSATEAKQGLAGLLDMAAREPVIIRRQKRNVAVVLSMIRSAEAPPSIAVAKVSALMNRQLAKS